MSMTPFPNEWELPESNKQNNPLDSTGCTPVEELIAAFSVGATNPEETALVQERLAQCPAAARDLAAYHRLAQALLATARPVAPPPELGQRLAAALAPETAPAMPRATAAPRRRGWLAGWRWSVVWNAAAVTAILLLMALNLYWIEQNTQLRQENERLVAVQLAQQQAENALYVLLASASRPGIELPPAQENSPANAEVIWNPNLNIAMLYAKEFPVLEPDQVYQLWMTKDGERQSAGLFSVDQGGSGVLIFPINQPLDQLDSMGITTEPAGGSPGPTGPPVVRRRFSDS
jgi:anti-sigma-K factor RskA